MAVYKFTDGRKGWYFQGYYEGKKYKKERWKGKHLDTKTAASSAEAEFLEEKRTEKDKANGNINLYELYDQFVNSSKDSLKVSSKQKYDTFKRIYLSQIEPIPIYDLKHDDILSWKNKIIQKNIEDEAINRNIKIMLAALKFGNLMYNIPGNLQLSLLEPYKSNQLVEEDNKSKFIPKEDFKKMLNLLDVRIENQMYYYTILLTLYNTGLRIGELAALTVKDYSSKSVRVNKNYIRINGEDYILPPKTSNSIRTVSLDDFTARCIDNYIETFKPTGTLFKLECDYINQQLLRRVMKKLGKLAGIDVKYYLHPHSLRHSHASNLRQMGFDEYVIAKRLGNTPKVAASTYIHSNEDDDKNIILALNDAKF